MNRAPSLFIRCIAAPAILLLPACDQDHGVRPPPPDPNPYQAQTSAASVLHNFIKAYQERNLDEYEKVFELSEFAFEFSRQDRERDSTIPVTWAFVDDRQSTKTMFDDEAIEKIVLRLTVPDVVPASENDQLPGGPEGVWKIAAQNVRLEVHTVDEQGEPLEYLVENDGADFFFRQYHNEPIDGPPNWRIVRWRDKPAGGATSATEKATWGRIKLRYF